MEFKSTNPYTLEEVGNHAAMTDDQLAETLEKSKAAFEKWRRVPISERAALMRRAGDVLTENTKRFAEMITLETGKPITEARAEVKKCKWVCDYYADNAAEFLADEVIKSDAGKSFVRHAPIGTVFAVMPWNFPFWQVFRYAAPTLTAGNTGILKHAANVFGCADLIESVFTEAEFPEGVFQSVKITHEQAKQVIAHEAVKAVTLTGSEKAGSAVAQNAGRHLKKTLLELGGSNAFIVLADADLDEAVDTAVSARMMNAGQSCISAKRFIIVDSVYEAFTEKFIAAAKKLKSGDPMDEDTEIGVLARVDLSEELQRQVQDSIKEGAVLLLGGDRKDAYHAPTVLGEVKPGMPAFDEETFGPLAAMVKAKDEDEAYALSQQSDFALGVTVCTKNTEKALNRAADIGDGAFFINELVKSDPRLPFGGQRNSGYGRELSRDGILEFVNRQTVYVK